MKVLVTGSSGFLGGPLVERLVADGDADVRALVRSGSNRARLDAIRQRRPSARLEVTVGSLASADAAAAPLEGVSVVYHLAAALSGVAADMFLNTVVTTKNLLEAAARQPVPPKIVLVSSFGVYGVAEQDRGHVVSEATPLERHAERRDVYSQVKIRQERLCWEYRDRLGSSLVVLRPGVIYGPGGSAFSMRVGLSFGSLFVHFGGDNRLPLSYVDNCADAIALAGRDPRAVGQIYNVHDDDLPTCREYLRRYRSEVAPIRSVRMPYFATMALSSLTEKYHAYSRGQLPAILTPYKSATAWKGNRFDNAKLKGLGWTQGVPTDEGLRRTFENLRTRRVGAGRP